RHGEGGLAMDADHANDAAIAEGNEVDILVVELVDQSAGPVVGELADLADKRPVIEAVHLFKLFVRFCAFKNVTADSQHSGQPPTVRGMRAAGGSAADSWSSRAAHWAKSTV